MGESSQSVLGPGAGQLGSLPREQRETLCSLEAGLDQVSSVAPREFEGTSAVDGCTRSLGGMEAPGALEVIVPGVIVPSVIVPVCAVNGVSATPCVDGTPSETPSETPCVSGVVASVPECMLPGTPCGKGAPQPETARVCEAPRVRETPRVSAPVGVSGEVCVSEARVSERPFVRRTACVRSLYIREMTVGMREHAAASPGVNGSLMECSLGVVTRRCAWIAWRRRLRQLRDQSRVAAVVAIGTVPGLHDSVRMVRAVQRTRPPRARLRG